MTYGNEQAFPRPSMGLSGLTKREHFAALAMQGLAADPSFDGYAKELSEMAVDLADELIKALNKEKTE